MLIYNHPIGRVYHLSSWWQLKDFLFSALAGEMIQFDSYFSNGLKSPTSYILPTGWVYMLPIPPLKGTRNNT